MNEKNAATKIGDEVAIIAKPTSLLMHTTLASNKAGVISAIRLVYIP